MRKTLLILVLVTVLPAVGQHYKPFKVETGLFWSELSKQGIGGMALVPYIEPKYNISDHFALGMRLEFLTFDKADFIDINIETQDRAKLYLNDAIYKNGMDISGRTFSLGLGGEYYLSTGRIRPYLGGGLAIYATKYKQTNLIINQTDSQTSAGIYFRIGTNINHFRIGGEWNILQKRTFDPSYFSLKLGYEIGGSKRLF